MTDAAMKVTEDKLTEISEKDKLSMSDISDGVITEVQSLESKDKSEITYIAENYLKNAEMAMEDDYNSIDGIIKDNAGTEVTTDIIFLQKHEGKSAAEISDIPDWVHIGETADGLPINKYFEQNPDMVLGTVVESNKLYGSGTKISRICC